MSEKVWKVVRVEGEKRLSVFAGVKTLTDQPTLNYSDGTVVKLCCAMTTEHMARRFAAQHSDVYRPALEVWEATCASIERPPSEDYQWLGGAPDEQVSARNLRLTKRVARYEQGEEVDCPEMAYEPAAPQQEEKPTHCENCGVPFATVPPDHFPKLCRHCSWYVSTNRAISRPSLAEDFEAAFVTREKYDAQVDALHAIRSNLHLTINTQQSRLTNLLAENATLQSDNAALKDAFDKVEAENAAVEGRVTDAYAEVDRTTASLALVYSELSLPLVSKDAACAFKAIRELKATHGCLSTMQDDIHSLCRAVGEFDGARAQSPHEVMADCIRVAAKLKADNAKMLPVWEAVHSCGWNDERVYARNFRLWAYCLKAKMREQGNRTLTAIAAALDPPAAGKDSQGSVSADVDQDDAAALCYITVTCHDCGKTRRLADEQGCPTCKTKREAEERFRPVKCSGCGVEGLLRPLPGGLAPAPWECSDCFAERMAKERAALTCPGCKKPMPPGEGKVSNLAPWEGRVYSEAECSACKATRKAEDAKRRLRERGKRVNAVLKPGMSVMINKELCFADGKRWASGPEREYGGQLAVCAMAPACPGSISDVRLANGKVVAFYAHNLTPWGPDGALRGFGEEDE